MRRRWIVVSLYLCIAFLPIDAYAVCDQSAASSADWDVWNSHSSSTCNTDFFLWAYKAYRMEEEDWGDRGWNRACDLRFEFTKHWNAAYLLRNGLADDHNYSFHHSADYNFTAMGIASDYHDSTFHTASDGGGVWGVFRTHLFGTNEVKTYCPLYDPLTLGSNPALRAGVFVHEGWHAWLHKNDYSISHGKGPDGNCSCSGNCCDYFLFHGVGEFQFGSMHEKGRPDSPYQMEAEFLCDLAERPAPWVPMSSIIAAQQGANWIATNTFYNGPGYTCGDPRPW